MTPDQMDEQKIRLAAELQKAERHLNHLREQANQQSDKIIQFAKWLRENPEIYIYRDPIGELHNFLCQPLENSAIAALDWRTAVETANKIREESARVRELKSRLERL